MTQVLQKHQVANGKEPPPGLVTGNFCMLIAVAEPDVLLRFSIVQSLERDGHTVLHAPTPGHAMRAIQESREPVDLLLTSVDFPYGSGLKLCRQVQLAHPSIRILAMADRLSTRRQAQAEDWEVLQKPFTAATLRKRVRIILGH